MLLDYMLRFLSHTSRMKRQLAGDLVFKFSVSIFMLLCGAALYHRTINMWSLKNLGDVFLSKSIGSRMIVLGTFLREKDEQNIAGKNVVIHFLGDARKSHDIYCISQQAGSDEPLISKAYIQRIHQGKRAANDICSWSGHLAECEVSESTQENLRVSSSRETKDSAEVVIEKPLVLTKKLDLVVCIAPLYIYTDWEIMLTGIETWLALGATKIIIPIQSASTTTYRILKAYEAQGLVVIRHWPKWPVLSDVNPNGLVLSRGIEESHVNCLFYVKPFADMVIFTDIDDMLLPLHPEKVQPGDNLRIMQSLFAAHPRAGSILFEHRDTQLILPGENDARVDSVNMHETGIHRFSFVQTRLPCREGHFYHLRHSHSSVEAAAQISLTPLANLLNKSTHPRSGVCSACTNPAVELAETEGSDSTSTSKWSDRLDTTFSSMADAPLNRSSTESFADFDRCMSAINEEHWKMKVSRCLTPHVCFSRLPRKVECVASRADFSFDRSSGDYFIFSRNNSFVDSLENCEAPVPSFTQGNHFFAP